MQFIAFQTFIICFLCPLKLHIIVNMHKWIVPINLLKLKYGINEIQIWREIAVMTTAVIHQIYCQTYFTLALHTPKYFSAKFLRSH